MFWYNNNNNKNDNINNNSVDDDGDVDDVDYSAMLGGRSGWLPWATNPDVWLDTENTHLY